MDVIPTIADKIFSAGGVGARFFFAPEPGIVGFGALGFSASVFVFEREWDGAEEACSAFPDIAGKEEGADVLADAVVDVGMPALGLVFEGLPADEDVVARVRLRVGFAFQYLGQLGL